MFCKRVFLALIYRGLMGLGILRGFSVETGEFVEGEMGIKEK